MTSPHIWALCNVPMLNGTKLPHPSKLNILHLPVEGLKNNRMSRANWMMPVPQSVLLRTTC